MGQAEERIREFDENLVQNHIEEMQKEEETQNKKCGQFDLLVMQNRVGKFRISYALIELSLKEIMDKIFSRVFIVKAEHLYDQRTMEYTGYCDLFEPQEFGYYASEYLFEFSKQPDETILVNVKKC